MELHDMSKGMCTMNVFELSQTLSRTNFPRQIVPKEGPWYLRENLRMLVLTDLVEF